MSDRSVGPPGTALQRGHAATRMSAKTFGSETGTGAARRPGVGVAAKKSVALSPVLVLSASRVSARPAPGSDAGVPCFAVVMGASVTILKRVRESAKRVVEQDRVRAVLPIHVCDEVAHSE